MKSESVKEIAAALAKAQTEFQPILRTKEVTVKTDRGSYSFRYAPFEEIVEAVRGPLANNGIAFSQAVEDERLVTTLLHSSGEWLCDAMPLPAAATNQAYGSSLTYRRRYALASLLGLATEDDDDATTADGNTISKTAKITPTAGVWEAMPVDIQTWLHDLSNEVRLMLSKGDVRGAVGHLNDSGMDADQKLAIWTRFDSKERAAIKKYKEPA